MPLRLLVVPARGEIRIDTADVEPVEVNEHIYDLIGDFFKTRPVGEPVAGMAPVMYFGESGKGQMNVRATILNQEAGGVNAIYGTAVIAALDEDRNRLPLTDELITSFGFDIP